MSSKDSKIPVNYRGRLEYNNKIYIIKEGGQRPHASFQFDGIMCRQGVVTGRVEECFQSKSKWFDSKWWYKKTCWGNEFPQKLYFHDNEFPYSYETSSKKLDKLADQYARPSENILKAILKNVEKHTDKKYEFRYPEETDYGKYWFEAYIPLKLGKTNYLLTWKNCD